MCPSTHLVYYTQRILSLWNWAKVKEIQGKKIKKKSLASLKPKQPSSSWRRWERAQGKHFSTNPTGKENWVSMPALLQTEEAAVLKPHYEVGPCHHNKTHISKGVFTCLWWTRNCTRHHRLISKHLYQSTKKVHSPLKSCSPTWPSLSKVMVCLQGLASSGHFIKHETKKPFKNCHLCTYSFMPALNTQLLNSYPQHQMILDARAFDTECESVINKVHPWELQREVSTPPLKPHSVLPIFVISVGLIH